MYYLQPQTVAALGGRWFSYVRRFQIGAGSLANPGSSGSGSIAVQSSGPFFSEILNITYPTVNGDADDLVTRLLVTFRNGSANVPLSSDYVRLSLLGVPGRVPSGVGPVIPVTPVLNIPGFPFPEYWDGAGAIQCDFLNEANVAAEVNVMFSGYIMPKEKVPDADVFWSIVRENQVSAPWVASP